MTRLPSFTHRLLAMAVAAVLALGACAPAGQAPQPSPASGATAKDDMQHAAPEFDRLFIDMMVPHHQAAVEMALIARQRAEHPEIKQLAEDIVHAQETEIAQMRQWRQQWYGSAARLAEQQAQRPEIKDLAREIIEAQQREIDQMRQWREAWYGVATG